MSIKVVPKAKGGLVSSDHSKRGRRYVSLLDPVTLRVSVLEPWEHAVLLLCDGERSGLQVTELLVLGVAGVSIDEDMVERCIQSFGTEGLLSVPEPTASAQEPASTSEARTVAVLQAALLDCCSDPQKLQKLLSGPTALSSGDATLLTKPSGSVDDGGPPDSRSLVVGSTLLLADSEAPFGELSDEFDMREGVSELLDAVDSDFEAAEQEERLRSKEVTATALPPLGKVVAGEASLPAAGSSRPPSRKVVTRFADDLDVPTEEAIALDPGLRLEAGSVIDNERGREIFIRMRQAGLVARSITTRAVDGGDDRLGRRRSDEQARRFSEGMKNLSAGDMHVALEHFSALLKEMPDSRRIRRFVEVVESVLKEESGARSAQGSGSDSRSELLASFEAMLEEAIAYGRCPQCLSMLPASSRSCFSCGFRIDLDEKSSDS